jgi:hypothetical protein
MNIPTNFIIPFIAIFIILFVLWLIGFLHLKKVGRGAKEYSDLLWWVHWGRFSGTLIIFLTSVIVAIVSVVSLMLLTFVGTKCIDKEITLVKLLVSPGILVVILTMVFTITTLVNTLIVKQREELKDIDEFGEFLEELTKCFKRYIGKKGSYIYIADFTPCIGSITLGLNNQDYKEYRRTLIGASESACNVILITYDDDSIDDFHKKMQVENVQQYNEHVKETIKLIEEPQYVERGEQRDKEKVDETWKNNTIGPLHLIVTLNEAYQYVVLPEPNGKKNTVAVIKRKEAFHISILRRSFEDMLADSITPRVNLDNTTDSLNLHFTPQDNILKALCFLGNNPSFNIGDSGVRTLDSDKSEITIIKNNTSSFCIVIPDITSKCSNNLKYLRVKLIKKSEIQSRPSKVVKIPNT